MHSKRRGRDGKILKWFNLGEWVAPGETVPDEMVHTFYLWYCADITARTAKILDKTDEAAEYGRLAEETREAFHGRFFDAENGTYGDGGGNILALKMGVPGDRYDQVVAAVKSGIRKNDGHLDTGIFGTRFLFEVLAGNGMQELAYEAMNKRTEPGFGYWVELGSTTTRESWGGHGSHNHPMFGGGLVWFYRNLAGMHADPEEPGYRHIIFRPQPAGGLEMARYHNRTSYGVAGISWNVSDEAFDMEITVPVSCHATINVPASRPENVYESGYPYKEAQGIEFLGMQGNYAVFKTGSGTYKFRSVNPVPGAIP
jgi:alpha-L-rhamnosidase